MITKEFAAQFSTEWVDSWNAHDMERILSHYTDDFEMASAYIIQIAGEPSGKLKGKDAVGAYWRTALERMPTLHFEHFSTLVGVESITIYYKGARGMAAEVFFFNADLKVWKCCAHYA
jgi:hypothetical protein